MQAPPINSLGAWYAFAQDQLDDIDAQALCAAAFNTNLVDIIVRRESIVSAEQTATLSTYIRRRQQGEPVAYIVGTRGFWRHDFEVSPATLIPRPESETLLEAVLPNITKASRVLELGTGSGALGVSLALETGACMHLTDISCAALHMAKRNAIRLGAQVRLIHSNWYEKVEGTFDCIVANPPYVASNDHRLHQNDLAFEPTLALDGGTTGLDALRIVVNGAPTYLRSGGRLAVEHGFDQAHAVRDLFCSAGFKCIELAFDLSGHPRVTHGILL